jgi:CRP-like cAMP-binding protein/flavin-dependent dehydrogenase
MTAIRAKMMFEHKLAIWPKHKSRNLKLGSGSSVAVIGGGPAGSFFSFFLLELAERAGLNVSVDIYDDKDFSRCGPAGCNHCGGIVSESLVQILAAEGINIPAKVTQKGIESYVLHMDVGSVRIETLVHEKRIAAMYRGAGPLGTKNAKWGSFDSFLQVHAVNKGAHLVNDRVKSICFDSNLPLVKTREGLSKTYNLLVGAVGVNNISALKLFKGLEFGYLPPQTTKTFICEFFLGQEMIQKYFGNSMHVFLLNIPRLEFAALIPKGGNITLVLLGKEIDKELVQSFLNTSEVKRCFPPGWDNKRWPCQCFPKINIKSALKPFADRVVLVGDCSTTKLYKNGIGAAYYTAKAAATTAIFEGISNEDFLQHYWPACQAITNDNKIGGVVFAVTRLIQKIRFARRGVLRMTSGEQQKKGGHQRMSMVLWDTFTGSATYWNIFLRTLHPFFLTRLLWETTIGFLPFKRAGKKEEKDLKTNALGRLYKDGEAIINQGETEDRMYVIQSGKVMVVQSKNGKDVKVAELGEGGFFGEMALFEHKVRMATVRSIGNTRVLTVDKKTLLHRIQEDPSMAFNIMQTTIGRIRKLDDQVSYMMATDRRNWANRCDTFTGSVTYWDIFLRTLHPFFQTRLLWKTTIGFLPFKRAGKKEEKDLKTNALGRLYKDGEAIINQGEREDCMYVIQSGKVMVVQSKNDKDVKVAELGEGDFFGEMALFEHKARMATVRSMGDTRVLAVDKKTLLHRVQEDPSMAFNIMQTTIGRVRKLDDQVSYMMATDRRNWANRPVNK